MDTQFWLGDGDGSKNVEKAKSALELLFDLSESDVKRCRPVMKPFNVTEEWWPWTHKYFPVLFRREVFVLLCVRKRLRWMSRDVLTLLIRALAVAHGDMPKSIAWTVPTNVFSTLEAVPQQPAWPYPVPPNNMAQAWPYALYPGHPMLQPHPPHPVFPPGGAYPLAGFQAHYMG